MCKVSVIVPVYKVEKYLNKCVDSIINQTLEDIEIILVDDGSPDNCGKICDDYAQKDNRIVVIHKTNGGLSDARNAGLEVARGEYIGFVDSDDYIAPEMISLLYGVCKKNSTDIAGCDLAYVYETTDRVDYNSNKQESVLSSDDFFALMLDVNKYLRTGVWNKIYKRSLFDTVRFPKGKLFEDVGTMYKLIFQVDKITYVSKPGYFYLKQREGAITSGKYSIKEYDRLEMNTCMVDYIKNNRASLLNTAMGYRAVNCHLSILNSMIESDCKDEEMVNRIQRDLRENIAPMLKSNQKILKKIQLLIAMNSFELYKKVYCFLKR